ncbi:MAG: lysophospholipid acyltransferase family protein [Candidatus Dormibacteria bacterium]
MSQRRSASGGAVRSNGHTRTRTLESLYRDLPGNAMAATGSLAMRLREVTGRDVIDLESLQDIVSIGYRVADVRSQHRKGEFNVDEFGFDPDFTNALIPFVRLLYRRYWRVDSVGLENIPRRGPALLVSNHSGVLPMDGAMIALAAHEETDRYLRPLIAGWFGSLPMLSWFLRRAGGTLGHPDDTLRLLGRGELVLVFPEGVRGTGKLYRERYRLRRFGRGGFVEMALRGGAPIIPISVVGAEEIYPMLADIQPVAKMLGFPYFPITPTWPWLGPLGLIPLPTKWRIRFHEPVRTEEYGAAAAEDPSTVMRISDEVRDRIQAGLVSELMERRSIFRG